MPIASDFSGTQQVENFELFVELNSFFVPQICFKPAAETKHTGRLGLEHTTSSILLPASEIPVFPLPARCTKKDSQMRCA